MNLLPRPRECAFEVGFAPDRVLSEAIGGPLPAQGYELRIGAHGVEITASDPAGLFYAHTTLRQLARVCGGRLPRGMIRDHPDIAIRGVMLDISRDKVPTQESLYALVERLASWKINHLQLYSEHTFAYRRHPQVHQDASPLTPEDMLALDAVCRQHHIELTPNQNCLGHMERWLRLAPYRSLALAPEGFVKPCGTRIAPMSLDPANPAAFALVEDLLDELLPHFASERVHIGLDEVWELPATRIGDFVDWIARLKGLPQLRDREVLIWGDMLTAHPDLLARVKDQVTVCEWGYEADHPFDEAAGRLAAAGAAFWVAPGTSSWLSLGGRGSNARENCLRAAEAAVRHGAAGYIVTDWGDQGHLQPPLVAEPALAYAAALAWNLEGNRDLDLAAALSWHAFDDPSGGFAAAVLELGEAYALVGPRPSNSSALVRHLYHPQVPLGQGETPALDPTEVRAARDRLGALRTRTAALRPGRADADTLREELAWVLDLLGLLLDDALARLEGDGGLPSIPAPRRRALGRRLDALIAQHGPLWLARNRPGGRQDSVAWLLNLAAAYESGRPAPDWAGVVVAEPEAVAAP